MFKSNKNKTRKRPKFLAFSQLSIFLLALILLSFLSLSGCKNNKTKPSIENLECSTDSDCSTAGCSSQICTTKEKAKDLITTCESNINYSCFNLTKCSCINNKCRFERNKEYQSCLKNSGTQQPII